DDGLNTSLNITNAVITDTTISGAVVPMGVAGGTYNVKVTAAGGTNTISTVKFIVTTPVLTNPNYFEIISPECAISNNSVILTIKAMSNNKSIVEGFNGQIKISGSALKEIVEYPFLPETDKGIKAISVILKGIGKILATDAKVEEVGGSASGVLSQGIKLYAAENIGLSGGKIVASDNTTVIVPSNALSLDTWLGITKKDTLAEVSSSVKKNLRAQDIKVPICYEFGKLNTSNDDWVLDSVNFGSPVTIEIPYTLSAIGDLKEKSLRIFVLEGTEWKIVEGDQNVDISKKVVRANVRHFSVYRILGTYISEGLTDVKVYPSPYKPKEVYQGKLKAIYLPDDSEMRIYGIAGDLINILKEGNTGNAGVIEWDGKNEVGEEVGQGVYIYIIKDEQGNKKIGKIGLIR
ncbi:MAG: hypothetical protein ABH873_01580, partial [Candidatus Firestonebacteria bacterium]